MRFTVEYPISSPGFAPEFLEPSTITRFAAAVEAAGVDALAFTEHPAPSTKWLQGGGHHSLDPLTALAFCAATTTRLRMMTYLLVLPYRNPLLAAKQIATADILSGGRLIVGVGSGYLRSEFVAVGAAFDERNDLLDEALQVIGHVWAADEFVFTGRHFRALGQASLPAPVQAPHPPLWIGGNSRRARERAAAWGQGWAPLLIEPAFAKTTRTAALSSVDELGRAVDELRQMAEGAGRDASEIDVQVHWRAAGGVDTDPVEALDRLSELAGAGVTWVVLNPPVDDVGRCLDLIADYGDNVIRPARAL
jgi:probable F420-dependent oxidoreductase